MTPLLLGLLLAANPASADDSQCAVLAELTDTVQVAWVSRKRRTVGANTTIEVVRVSELRAWIRTEKADPLRLAQGLGMVGRKVRPDGRAADRDYKVVLFDVQPEWLCRPIEDGLPGERIGGVPACSEGDQGPIRHHRRGHTGCGYTLDSASSTRGLDVYRITWADATSQGFCMFPLERFLEGA